MLYAMSDWWWTGLDSNQRTLARADLQSAAFNHSATCPHQLLAAENRSRRSGTRSVSKRRFQCLAAEEGAYVEPGLACQWGYWQERHRFFEKDIFHEQS